MARLARLLVPLLALLAAPPALAWPERPVRFVVSAAAGGSNDTVARVVAEALSAQLPFPVIVENRPGAQGMLGAEAVVRAPPDGHTALFSNTGQAGLRVMAPNASVDVATALAPVAVVAESPMVMLVANNVPAPDLRALLAMARAEPGRFDYATSSGAGTLQLAGLLFLKTTGLELVAVPDRGGAPAQLDLIAGRINIVFDVATVALATARAGQARAFAVTGAQRSPHAPEVPTWREMGVEAEMTVWQAAWLASATPLPLRQEIHAAFARALRSERLRLRMAELGADRVLALSLPETEAYVAAEVTRWEALLR